MIASIGMGTTLWQVWPPKAKPCFCCGVAMGTMVSTVRVVLARSAIKQMAMCQLILRIQPTINFQSPFHSTHTAHTAAAVPHVHMPGLILFSIRPRVRYRSTRPSAVLTSRGIGAKPDNSCTAVRTCKGTGVTPYR